jgi:type 1 glutamine amidotransferase
MKPASFFIVFALVTGAIASAQDQPAAQISHVFPPENDLRKPDRTIPNAEAGPAAIIAYSPDGRFLFTAGKDHIIRVRDARTGEQETGELLRSLKGPDARILALASPSADSLVSMAADQAVRTWNFSTGELLSTVPLKIGPDIGAVAFLPGDEPLLAEAGGHQVRLWNYATGQIVRSLATGDAPPRDLAFTPDGKILAVATATGAIQLWDAGTGKLVRLIEPDGAIETLAACATQVAAGCADGRVKWIPIDVQEPARVFSTGQGDQVSALAFSPKGDQFAAVGADRLIKVWDVETGTLLCSQKGHAAKVVSIVFSPNGQKMASGGADGTINYWTVPLPPIPPGDLEKIKAALPAKATAVPKKPRRLLVFWRADAILHKGGVPAANHAIELMGEKTGAFTADFTRDYDAFDPKVLANYDAIVMNSTAHLAMPESAKRAYLDFVRRGGGVVGIHAAIDTFRNWPEGAAVIGATFANHPWHPTGTWAVKLEEPDHPLLRAWAGKNFRMHDEFYEMGDPYTRADRRVLLTVDLSDPATAGVPGLHRKDKDFALSWIKRFGQGRVFYCDFGHLGEPFQNPAVLQYYLDGIQYALGDLEVDDTPKTK